MKPIFDHITVPLDGSTASKRGVAFALEFVRDGGRVSFCSVVDPTLVNVAVQGAGVDPVPVLDILDADAAVYCRSAGDEAALQGSICDTRVLHGPCIEAIQSYAADNGSAAIVMGTHGRTTVSRAALGSVAQGIVRRSDIPVISVHADDALRSGPLAVAIDLSRAAEAALDVAQAIAAARGMPTVIVHVRTPASRAVAIDALLARATEHLRARGITTQVIMREGDAAAELLAVAAENDCCMIVIGTHGRSPLVRLALGSVAAALVERAHLPVLTIRCAA